MSVDPFKENEWKNSTHYHSLQKQTVFITIFRSSGFRRAYVRWSIILFSPPLPLMWPLCLLFELWLVVRGQQRSASSQPKPPWDTSIPTLLLKTLNIYMSGNREQIPVSVFLIICIISDEPFIWSREPFPFKNE